ncbi:ubiquinone biosynthesis accessory factor UbiJ [Coxiella-like endosymbiont]|uniref:ubiquinone biosynthesis accessory factor UbiJ n=1 Tax=Coxiella-like endosymbiont TaxID=1592897 RepID=UPI00272BC5D1|nr:SCP2 sterol-binding domain-containing protein [Coxiella-like endosymbiont]
MFTLVLSRLEKIINAYLELDSNRVQRLSLLENKIIKVQIIDWNTEFFILPTKKGLQLTAASKKEPDTIISGTLLNLFKTVCTKGSSSALFKNQVEISGDTWIGEQIRDILTGIDIDWEEHLSKITGDILAHQIGLQVRRVANFGKFALETFRMDVQDYLQNESQIMPSSEEVEFFIQSVTDLQHNVDRVEARIQRLMIKRNLTA